MKRLIIKHWSRERYTIYLNGSWPHGANMAEIGSLQAVRGYWPFARDRRLTYATIACAMIIAPNGDNIRYELDWGLDAATG